MSGGQCTDALFSTADPAVQPPRNTALVKSIMKSIAVVLIVLDLLVNASRAAAASPTRPNVIVVFTDDQGFADLGCQGVRSDVKTPNIDSLARSGIRMTHGYVTAPQCEPSRAAILSGRYQQFVGVENNLAGTMHSGIPTIASRLKAAGYVTGMVGKWGVGGGPTWQDIMSKSVPPVRPADLPLLPGARGFVDYFSGVQTLYVASYDLAGKTITNAPVMLRDDRYRVEVQNEAAVAFIERHAKDSQPFFLYFAPYAPHVPLAAPQKYLDRFPNVKDVTRRTGLAMISCIDDGVGQILATLRERHLETNTLVWFISDNGAPRNNGSLNEPLGGWKGSLLDGGVRIPFLVSWPGKLPAGKVYDSPVSSLDVLPTSLAAAGVTKVDGPLDGVNLLPFLRGENKSDPHEALFFRWSGQSAIRVKDWKLLRTGARHMLFNLTTDPGEKTDVRAEQPELSAALDKRLGDWLATLPEIKPDTPRGKGSRKVRADGVSEPMEELP
jgi:arylsulfatase A-like enzyme